MSKTGSKELKIIDDFIAATEQYPDNPSLYKNLQIDDLMRISLDDVDIYNAVNTSLARLHRSFHAVVENLDEKSLFYDDPKTDQLYEFIYRKPLHNFWGEMAQESIQVILSSPDGSALNNAAIIRWFQKMRVGLNIEKGRYGTFFWEDISRETMEKIGNVIKRLNHNQFSQFSFCLEKFVQSIKEQTAKHHTMSDFPPYCDRLLEIIKNKRTMQDVTPNPNLIEKVFTLPKP